MKKTFDHFLVIISMVICFSGNTSAQESKSDWYISGSIGLYSCYPFAGLMYGGLSLYPYIETGYCVNDNFSLVGCAAVMTDFDSDLFLPGSLKDNNSCIEFDLGICWGPFALYLDDLIDRFRLCNESSHYLGIWAEWTLSNEYPLFVSWYSLLSKTYNINSKGNRAFSTIIDVSYPFQVGKRFKLGPDIAFVPWDSPFCGYDKSSVCQIGATGQYLIPVGDKFHLPLSMNAGWNPTYDRLFWWTSLNFVF